MDIVQRGKAGDGIDWDGPAFLLSPERLKGASAPRRFGDSKNLVGKDGHELLIPPGMDKMWGGLRMKIDKAKREEASEVPEYDFSLVETTIVPNSKPLPKGTSRGNNSIRNRMIYF